MSTQTTQTSKPGKAAGAITVGTVIVFEAQGEKKTGRVIALYRVEEFTQVTRKALAFTPGGPAMLSVPVTEAAVAADQKERTALERERAAAYLEDSAWFGTLDAKTALLMTDVFLDCVEFVLADAPNTSRFAIALHWDHVLRQVLDEVQRHTVTRS
ncbi:hypothetical protein ACIRPQ_28920 [Streptomyces sp. NPDC101213]|uniref:hypothetical protein n=1 Tax=Streptomyces sp. NPDC101213 TaxID=3366130 RepID=UPI0037F3B80D